MFPTDASNLKFWWHVHPNTTIGEISLRDSNPSPADRNVHRKLFDNEHRGNSFVIGTKTNTVTFYNHKRSLITVKYSDFKKMGGK